MQLLDGKALSQKLKKQVAAHVAAFSREHGITLKLVIIQVGKDSASSVYIRQKKKSSEETGIDAVHLELPDSISTEDLEQKIYSMNQDPNVHGILVQLPLPSQISTPRIFKALDPAKDVDGFTAYNVGKMVLDKSFEDLVPCTPRGVIHLLEEYEIEISGKEATVVGRSNIVGKPLAAMLMNRGATVSVCHSKTKDLAAHTKNADLLFVAVGKTNLITADMIKKGAIIVDIGMNRKPDGKLCGDVDFEAVKEKCSFITPVPGGVGPMTVACLMENVLRAAKKQLGSIS